MLVGKMDSGHEKQIGGIILLGKGRLFNGP